MIGFQVAPHVIRHGGIERRDWRVVPRRAQPRDVGAGVVLIPRAHRLGHLDELDLRLATHCREESARELAPYRSRMKTEQIRQVEQQFLRKRLLEKYNLPRLSLFYMSRQ